MHDPDFTLKTLSLVPQLRELTITIDRLRNFKRDVPFAALPR